MKTSSSVSLSWTASTDNVGVTAYDVYNASTLATSVTTTTTTTATVTGLSPATTYTFTVKARDAAGNTSPASNQASATTNAASGGGSSGHKRVAYFTPVGHLRPGLHAERRRRERRRRETHTDQLRVRQRLRERQVL